MPTPSEIQTCIDNLSASSEAIDFTLLAAETSNANTGISFSVATVDDLPVYSDVGLGQIFFVESIAVPVISTRSGWSGLDGRVLSGTGPENAIFSWGLNSCGQLGDGAVSISSSPRREITFSSSWCQVSGLWRMSTALKSSGELWGWGANLCGELGDGTTTNRCSPVREFCSATNWCQVQNSAAIKTSGELWAWGCNNCGRLGDGTLTTRCSPVREFCSATNWCQVSVSLRGASALKTSGELWSWGIGVNGRLGDGTTVNKCSPVREICSATNWCQVSSSLNDTMAIKTSGELWGWGSNICGVLGDGTVSVAKCSPIREICSATNWCQVSVGYDNTAALKTSGELWTWGNNVNRQLGDGTATSRCSPVREFCSATDWCQVSAGCRHMIAIKTSGELWGWGNNVCGLVGDGTFTRHCSPVREFCSATDWCQISASVCHNMGIRVII